ncbi:fibronectin type III domain-containing protein, partial [Paenibacillus sepulcri]|nr:fibronectin type III domain-containing protein [Paenibacillus sepulcri]
FRFLRYLGPDGSSANVAELEFYGIEGDIAAPSAPASLQVAGVTETTVSLSWSPSTDNDTVTGYTVYADGKAAGTTADTSFTVRGLEPDRSYVF